MTLSAEDRNIMAVATPLPPTRSGDPWSVNVKIDIPPVLAVISGWSFGYLFGNGIATAFRAWRQQRAASVCIGETLAWGSLLGKDTARMSLGEIVDQGSEYDGVLIARELESHRREAAKAARIDEIMSAKGLSLSEAAHSISDGDQPFGPENNLPGGVFSVKDCRCHHHAPRA